MRLRRVALSTRSSNPRKKNTQHKNTYTFKYIYNIYANSFACVFIYEFDRNAFDIKWLNLMPADISTISIIWKAIKIFHFIPYFSHKISENNKMNISYVIHTTELQKWHFVVFSSCPEWLKHSLTACNWD